MHNTAGSRERRDCRCARSRHVHGTLGAYQRDRCRCLPCRAARARAATAYRRGKGFREVLVDAQLVKQQLRALASAGVTARRIAAHTGLSRDMLSYLRSGPQPSTTCALADVVANAYNQLIFTGRSDANARRCSTQAKAAGWRPFVEADDIAEYEPPELRPHGTHAAFTRHRNRGETPCARCVAGEKQFQAERHLRRKAERSAAA